MNKLKHSDSSAFIQKAATICYIVSFIASNLIIIYNQFDNITNRYIFLITIDALSLSILWCSFILFRIKHIKLKLVTAILSYSIFSNIIISNFYLYYQSVNITNNFLTCTIIFCINILVVGFCSGRIHLFISAAYYIISFLLLLHVSNDRYLAGNAFTLIISVVSFSVGLSYFLNVLNKVHKEELDLRQELYEKETMLIRERADKLRLELEAKQKELTIKAIYLLKLVESNNVFITKLNGFKKEIKQSGLRQFESVISEHQGTRSDIYWKEFETCFQEVHKDFYQNLLNKFPALTPSERRMAAFVKLDLSTKQIADITFNSIHSVEVARSRLRKKLNLDYSSNLKDFLDRF